MTQISTIQESANVNRLSHHNNWFFSSLLISFLHQFDDATYKLRYLFKSTYAKLHFMTRETDDYSPYVIIFITMSNHNLFAILTKIVFKRNNLFLSKIPTLLLLRLHADLCTFVWQSRALRARPLTQG